MADLTTDLIFGVVIVVVAAIAIFFFLRAGRSGKKNEEKPPEPEESQNDPMKVELQLAEKRVKVPPLEKKIALTDVEHAKSQIRTLTLKQEINSIVLRRLFEAEDEGEISRDERIRLGKAYEDEMKLIADDLKRSEMLVSLAELESIREEIVKKFEESLSQTQSKIDLIIKELKIEEPKPIEEEKPKHPSTTRRRRIVKERTEEDAEEEVEEAEEVGEHEEGEKESPKQDVESRLEQLKKEVMKELDELDKLELETP